MLKIRNFFRVITGAFFALCLVFATDSVWAVTYTITLNQNGGSIPSGKKNKIEWGPEIINGNPNSGEMGVWHPSGVGDEDYCIGFCDSGGTVGSLTDFTDIALPTREGYTFNGYWSATSGGTQYFDSTGKPLASLNPMYYDPFTGNATIYAQWKPLYTLTFDNGTGGSGGPGAWYFNSTGVYSNDTGTTAVSWPISVPSKTGYTFAGYSYDGNTVINSDGGKSDESFWGYYLIRLASSNQTITAQWTAKSIQCAPGYYLKANSEICNTLCPMGKYCEGGTFKYDGTAKGVTGNIAAGYYSYSGGISATPTGSGNGCVGGSSCGIVAAGYFCEGGCTKAEPNDTIGGATATGTNGCITGKCGKVSAGYYSSGGGTSATPTERGNGCLATNSLNCGPVAAGRYSTGGATTAQGTGAVGIGYYSSGGATISTPASTSCVGSGNTCGACSTWRTNTTTSGSGSTGTSSCLCKAGTYLSGTTCTTTETGYYSGISNSKSACTDYRSNTTTNGTGKTSSSDCLCKGGMYLSGTTCTNASAGYYSSVSNTQTVCDVDTYSTAGATSCTPVSTGYHTTGCNSSSKACTGQSANTYTVTLNKNATDATAGTASVTATYDSNMPTPITLPTRIGYTFAGYYNTSAATGGTQYYNANGASGRTWNRTEDTILYARWVTKSISCDPGYYLPANKETCSSCPPGRYCEGGTFTYDGSEHGITGYVSAGYYSGGSGISATPTGSGNGCVGGSSCGKVTAGYFCEGGCTKAEPNETIGGATATGTNGCITGKCGKVSAGCYGTLGATTACPAECAAGSYSTGGASGCTPCATGYGNTGTGNSSCSANTYTVTYSCGTGTTGSAPTSGTATYNSNYTPKSNNTCAKAGYTFAGWSVGSDNWTAGTAKKWTYTSAKTFTARWTANTITIKWTGVETAGTGFTAVSGESNAYTSTVTYDGDIITPASAVVANAGQTFLGWKFSK